MTITAFILLLLQVVSEKAYEDWSVNRQRALAAIDGREELTMDTAVQLETNLTLLGNSSPVQTPTNIYLL